jgi:flavin-dependent dehydrogenase
MGRHVRRITPELQVLGQMAASCELLASSAMSRPIRTVAIVGGGPAGAALATFLASGRSEPSCVVLFASGSRPPLVIGESLVPAVVPFLQELGIEDEVREYSVFKPGATFVLRDGEMSFRFDEVRKARTPYSYNVPRDRFDDSILAAARRAGAHVVSETARFDARGDRVLLDADTIAAAPVLAGRQPDLVVDATGRTRALARLFDLPTEEGDRRDTALFAHCEGVPLLAEGHVHTDYLERGWGWRIPLRGRVSVGLVLDSNFVRSFGSNAEEQFDRYLAHDPAIKAWGGEPKRISPVLRYTNYQLATTRGYGENWALVGDAFGFIDPVFSSGLLVSLDAAHRLARAIESGGGTALEQYQDHVLRHLRNWQRIVDHFYDGRLFTLLRVGQQVGESRIGRLLNFHFEKHLPRVFTGEATTKRYSVGLLDFMCRRGLLDEDPDDLRVR